MDLSALEKLLDQRDKDVGELTFSSVTAAPTEPDKRARRGPRKTPDLVSVARRVVMDRETLDEMLRERDPRAGSIVSEIVDGSSVPLVRGAALRADDRRRSGPP